MNRQLPSALEAEASLLGTMMIYPSAARVAMEEGLQEDDFFSEPNKRIFAAMVEMYKAGKAIDITTVSTWLSDKNGLSYLTDLTNAAVTSANTRSYISLIQDKAVMRNMIAAAEEIAQAGFDGQTDINEYLDQSEKEILNVSRNRRAGGFKTSPELMNEALDNIRKMADSHSDITGMKTGFNEMDHTLHGLQRGDFIVLAARPAMGKTAVALNLAMNVAAYQPNEAVAIFSLEMSAEQLAMRLLSAKSRIQADKLKTGRLSDEEWNTLIHRASRCRRSFPSADVCRQNMDFPWYW